MQGGLIYHLTWAGLGIYNILGRLRPSKWLTGTQRLGWFAACSKSVLRYLAANLFLKIPMGSDLIKLLVVLNLLLGCSIPAYSYQCVGSQVYRYDICCSLGISLHYA